MMMFSSKCCYLSSSVLIFLVVFSNVLCISQSLRKCPSVKRHGSFCFSYPQFDIALKFRHCATSQSDFVGEYDELKEAVKLFGRLSDKLLLLDVEGAGTPEMANCCHGGCDNCNYSRIFDSMSAGRPKWVAMYASRLLIDGRSHSSPWKSLFLDDTTSLSQEEFIIGLQKLPYRLSMGAPSLPEEVDSADLPSEAMLRKLWRKIAGSGDVDERISHDQLFSSLKFLTGEEHGAMWSSFYKLFKDSNIVS